MIENAKTTNPELIGKLDEKLGYLSDLRQAILVQDDRLVFELLARKKYQQQVLQQPGKSNDDLAEMVVNLKPQLSHLLANKLIAYLSVAFPFFYYKEIDEGVYQIYFGNWWDRRSFGYLDVLDVKFIFDKTEYQKLTDSVALAKENKRLNTEKITTLTKNNEHLQELVDGQSQRDMQKGSLRAQIDEVTNTRQGLFANTKLKEQRDELVAQLEELQIQDEEAKNARTQIIENNDQILFYSKEDTILSYEYKSIVEKFGDFDAFETAVDKLYTSYLATLIATEEKGAFGDYE
ncbi:exonuclease SbcC [Periweissella fabalis]|uniref:Exonuclease SbcC n=1 Tax=Periweissella fabalis TaxID=1070421 RepID=A0A7X6N322_9LACO|nr:exonuclease SbcC [Periweissella fabalis]MCM0598523.1 exonuclease SbcC [Periweissella fabalis]NKZ24195.1 exonuclease SbcC [Periweissella fabalis]